MEIDFQTAKSMVLLGAGASVEAGIPTAVSMTQRIIEDIEASPYDPKTVIESSLYDQKAARVLRFVEAGLRLRESIRGETPFRGINIEELFAAIEMLAKRQELEIAPFVNQWHPLLEEIETNEPYLLTSHP